MSTIDKHKTSFVIANLVVIGIVAALLFNLVTIPLVSPAQGLQTTERRPVLAWGGMQRDYVVLLDNSPEFPSPAVATTTSNSYTPEKDLEFGTYYWKVVSGLVSSGVGRFMVSSSVVLSRTDDQVTNEGNTRIILQGPSITGAFVLGMNESAEIGAKENVMAEQE